MCGTKQKRQSLRVLELAQQLHYIHYIHYLHGVLIGFRFIKRNSLDIVNSAKLCLIQLLLCQMEIPLSDLILR